MRVTRRQSALSLLAQGVSHQALEEHQPELAKAATAPPRRNAQREQPILNAVLALLRTHPKVAWAARINSGAYKTPDGRFIRFGFAGCSDIIGQMRDGRFLAVECKAEHGRSTDDQEAFIARVKAAGGVAGFARSVDDALAILNGAEQGIRAIREYVES